MKVTPIYLFCITLIQSLENFGVEIINVFCTGGRKAKYVYFSYTSLSTGQEQSGIVDRLPPSPSHFRLKGLHTSILHLANISSLTAHSQFYRLILHIGKELNVLQTHYNMCIISLPQIYIYCKYNINQIYATRSGMYRQPAYILTESILSLISQVCS